MNVYLAMNFKKIQEHIYVLPMTSINLFCC